RSMDDLEMFLHLAGGLAEHNRAANIGLVSFHVTTSVDEQNGSFTNHLRLGGAVWQSRTFSHLHSGAALETELRMSSLHQGGKVVLGHALAQRAVCRLVRGQRHLI